MAGAPGTTPPWSTDIVGLAGRCGDQPWTTSPPAWPTAVKPSPEHLTEAGAVIDEIEIADFEDCVDLDFDIIDAEVALYHRPWYENVSPNTPARSGPRVGTGFSIGAADYLEHRRRAEAYPHRLPRRTTLGAISSFSLACPHPHRGSATSCCAMGEESDQYDHALCRNTSFANLTGLPALAVPAGLEAGLPVGVQFAAGHFDDYPLLAAGQVLWERLDPPRLAPI